MYSEGSDASNCSRVLITPFLDRALGFLGSALLPSVFFSAAFLAAGFLSAGWADAAFLDGDDSTADFASAGFFASGLLAAGFAGFFAILSTFFAVADFADGRFAAGLFTAGFLAAGLAVLFAFSTFLPLASATLAAEAADADDRAEGCFSAFFSVD